MKGSKPMTVDDLISILSEYSNRNLTVLVDGYEAGLCDVKRESIRLIRFNRDDNISDYLGPHEEDSDGEFKGVVIGRS